MIVLVVLRPFRSLKKILRNYEFFIQTFENVRTTDHESRTSFQAFIPISLPTITRLCTLEVLSEHNLFCDHHQPEKLPSKLSRKTSFKLIKIPTNFLILFNLEPQEKLFAAFSRFCTCFYDYLISPEPMKWVRAAAQVTITEFPSRLVSLGVITKLLLTLTYIKRERHFSVGVWWTVNFILSFLPCQNVSAHLSSTEKRQKMTKKFLRASWGITWRC